jgi:cobalt-zinc-cadmium efflux system protein
MTDHEQAISPASGDRRVAVAIVINLGLTVAQIVGGVMSGSLALIADALHNLSDAIALIIAIGARKMARRPPNAEMTFGYGRVEVVATLINYTILIVIGLYLLLAAAMRLYQPRGVNGWPILIIASVALVINVFIALSTFGLPQSRDKIRAAFMHNVADVLGSIAVMAAGAIIILFDWRWIDPLVTLLIASYILWRAFKEIGGGIRILMLGSPPDLNAETVVAMLRQVDGMADVHHVHLWQLDEHKTALDAHIVIEPGAWGRADAVKTAAKMQMLASFGILHTTLEMECSIHACQYPSLVGAN